MATVARRRKTPMKLHGAAEASRAEKIKRLLDYGLLRDAEGRTLVRLEFEEAERRLKERASEVSA